MGDGRAHTHGLCGEVIRALQTSSKQKGLRSAEGEERREGGGTEGGKEGGGGREPLLFHGEVPGGQHGA